MTKSSKKLTAFGMALIVAILIGGFLLHPWGRTKSELTVTKVDLSDNSIYATAPINCTVQMITISFRELRNT